MVVEDGTKTPQLKLTKFQIRRDSNHLSLAEMMFRRLLLLLFFRSICCSTTMLFSWPSIDDPSGPGGSRGQVT